MSDNKPPTRATAAGPESLIELRHITPSVCVFRRRLCCCTARRWRKKKAIIKFAGLALLLYRVPYAFRFTSLLSSHSKIRLALASIFPRLFFGLGWAGLTRLALSYKSQAYRESLVVNFLSTRLCRPMSRPEPI